MQKTGFLMTRLKYCSPGDLSFCNFVIFNFGFEGLILVQIVPVPGDTLSVASTLICKGRQAGSSIYYKTLII